MANDENTLYQALIVTDPGEEKEGKFSQGIRTRLLTKPRSKFPKAIRDNLPSKGAELLPGFLPTCEPDGQTNEDNLSKRYGSRTLLVYRKISQMVAKSWLPDNDEEKKQPLSQKSLIRKLILTANLPPDKYSTFIPDDIRGECGMTPKGENAEDDEGKDALDDLYDISKEPPGADGATNRNRSTIILPDALNWEYIRLSLLCAGQAYYKTKDKDDKAVYTQINEPIMSTYDICVVFAFTLVSWSDYIATFAELVQPGRNQKPPYYKVTFPYPPRPNLDEFTGLNEEELDSWANAQETGGDLPFYPPKKDGEYESDLVRNIVPPYPYIPPTSSSC